ncbi:MAG: CDP-alcohol phosphatidyltransferase family protein [Candidatus Rokubacteria bacterium]|nr:CDP-alcohol phosphatidyltransferase family protein [Candidatus Rokubacteria bacterium]
MIRQAALYLVSSDDARAALLTIGGRPLAFRLVMAALRAGAERVAVPAVFRGTAVERAIAASPRARAGVVWLPDAGLDAGPALLVPAAAVVTPLALVPLLAAAGPAVLAGSGETGAPVVAADAALAATLAAPLAAGAPLGDRLHSACAGAAVVARPGTWMVRVADAAGLARAEARLYASLGSPIDTRLDTLVHRRLSLPLSRLAVTLGVTPNAITLASVVVGLAAAWCLGQGSLAAAIGGLLGYLLAVVLDHADGEVARLTLTESALGERLDVLGDTIVHAALVLAMGVTAARVAGAGGVTGVVAALGVAGSAVVAKLSPALGADGVPPAGLGRLLTGLGTRDGYYAMLLAFVALLAAWPAALPGLMVLVAAGSHAYWVGRAAYRRRRG